LGDFFWSVCFLFLHSSTAARRGREVTTGFPIGTAKETKWPPVSHFVPTQPAGCSRASRWSGPVLPRPSPCSGRLKSFSGTRRPDFPLRSPACPRHVLAPTRGTGAIQRLKAVSAFKGATLLFYGFLLPPPPLLHFIQYSLINQISSSKLRNLSSYSMPPCFKGRGLAVLGRLWSADGLKFGEASAWVVCWGSHHEDNRRTAVGHLSFPKMSLKAGLEIPVFYQPGGSCCEETYYSLTWQFSSPLQAPLGSRIVLWHALSMGTFPRSLTETDRASSQKSNLANFGGFI